MSLNQASQRTPSLKQSFFMLKEQNDHQQNLLVVTLSEGLPESQKPFAVRPLNMKGPVGRVTGCLERPPYVTIVPFFLQRKCKFEQGREQASIAPA